MEAETLVRELERLDVVLSARAGKLVCNAPKGALTDALRDRITRLRPQLLALLEARAPEQRVPLSRSQARIHAIATLLPAAGAASNVPLAFRLVGALDIAALERALGAVVQRHEAFRTRCGPGPCAIVQPTASLSVPLEDLRSVPLAVRSVELRRRIDALIAAPLPLDVAPILRAAVLRTNDDEWIMVLVTHLFVFDGRSTPLLLDELGERYADALAGREPSAAPPAPGYSSFVYRQQRELDEGLLARQRAFWRSALAGTSTIVTLDDATEPELARGERRCGHVPVTIPPTLADAARGLARRSGATLFHTLLAAFAVLLQRYTLRPSLAIGTIVSDRRDLAAERTIGSFANNILLRADFGPGARFDALLLALRDRARAALANLELPFESLLPELPPALRGQPPFRVMFVLHQRSSETEALRLPALQVAPFPVDETRSHYLLDLVLSDAPGGIAGSLVHAAPALSRATAEVLVERYIAVLEAVCAAPDVEIDALPAHRIVPRGPAAGPVVMLDELPVAASPPLGNVEQAIARIWAELLDLPQVARDQDFFDLGGHSLLALAMLHAVEAELGPLEPDALARFAEHTTVAGLARLLPARSTVSDRSERP